MCIPSNLKDISRSDGYRDMFVCQTDIFQSFIDKESISHGYIVHSGLCH